MQKFYVASLGIQQGPWLLEVIAVKLKNKELAWNDYIFDEVKQDWILLLEFPQFTDLFNKSFSNPIVENQKVKEVLDPIKERAWFILKQNNNYGPFSQIEMIQMLQSKSLHEFDFVWKKGMDSWKKLADVAEFDSRNTKELYNAFSKHEKNDFFFRRRHARVNYSSSLIVHNRKILVNAHSLEISAGGAGLVIDSEDFKLEQELYLHFSPSAAVPAFNTICKVVSKSGNKYGVQFLALTSIAKDSIANYTKQAA